MFHYRIYFLSPNGRVFEEQNFEAPDDDAALAEARARARDHALEIWQSARCLASLQKGGAVAASSSEAEPFPSPISREADDAQL